MGIQNLLEAPKVSLCESQGVALRKPRCRFARAEVIRERMVRSVFFVKAVDDEWCVVK